MKNIYLIPKEYLTASKIASNSQGVTLVTLYIPLPIFFLSKRSAETDITKSHLAQQVSNCPATGVLGK